MPDIEEKLLYSTAEACRRLNVGKTKLFELIASGELASTRIGSSRLVAAADLDDFVSRLRTEGADPVRVTALLALVDADGKIDIDRIPANCTLSDLESAKRVVAERRPQVA